MLLVAVVGCRPEPPIAHYRARDRRGPSTASNKSDGMLAAIVEHGDRGWFFKLTRPVAAVGAHVDAFKKFAESIHFEGDEPRTPPEDWQAQGPSGMRHETFQIPADGKPLELAISSLPKPAEGTDFLLSNVNRWRGQLGLAPVAAEQLDEQTNRLKLSDGGVATLVVLVGKLQSGGPMGPPPSAAGGGAMPTADTRAHATGGQRSGPKNPENRAARDKPPGMAPVEAMLAALVPHGDRAWFFKLTGSSGAVAAQREAFARFIGSVRFAGDNPAYDAPGDWQAQGPAGMRFETFRIPTDGSPLELAISSLLKPPGDDAAYVLSNVNRWRGQLGRPAIEADQLADQTQSIKLADGTTATVVDLAGKDSSGAA